MLTWTYNNRTDYDQETKINEEDKSGVTEIRTTFQNNNSISLELTWINCVSPNRLSIYNLGLELLKHFNSKQGENVDGYQRMRIRKIINQSARVTQEI